MTKTLTVQTQHPSEVINITGQVIELLDGSPDSLVCLATPHTTAAVFLGEDDEQLRRDYLRVACDLLAPLEPFEHCRNDNPNARAHLISALVGTHLCLPFVAGKLGIGRYQNILMLELDGPKERQLTVTAAAV